MKSYPNIGLSGQSVGAILLSSDGLEWRDRSNNISRLVLKNQITSGKIEQYGSKFHLKIHLEDDDVIRFDGFSMADTESIIPFFKELFGIFITKEEISCDGAHFGDIKLAAKEIQMESAQGLPRFDVRMEQISQCVVPISNRNEIEIHFHEPEKADREEDGLVQVTFHFPHGDGEEEDTMAEKFKKSIMDSGYIHSVTGNIIVEFSKEQGNFVNPRGKYGIQMMSTYLHMQGTQYSYKIKYDDIHSLFLLPRPDGGRMAFVISLDKPIRQGNQKYQHLILESHKLEHTIKVNLTEEEIQEKFDGQLSPVMSMPLSSLIAKVFKVLSQTTVFVPKHFVSVRGSSAVRCSLKANDGLLYPLAKSFIFINKPTVILKFEDIESVEFQRYDPSSNSANRNFDLVVTLLRPQSSGEPKEFSFSSIDRTEYTSLFDFLTARKLNVRTPKAVGGKISYSEDALFGVDEDDAGPARVADLGQNSSDEEDEDYEGGSQSDVDDDDDDQEDEDEEDDDGNGNQSTEKSQKLKSITAGNKRGKPVIERKSKKPKKDPLAPKGASSSYIFFSQDIRAKIIAENPGIAVTEVAKEAGNRWKLLSPVEREFYEEKARNDKQRYLEEMARYKESMSSESLDG